MTAARYPWERPEMGTYHVEIDCRIRRDRDRSVGIASPHDAGGIVFLPLSLIEVLSHDVPSGRARIKIPRWLVVEKGIEALVDDEGAEE